MAGDEVRGRGLLEDISISLRLHTPKEIVLINHGDCGAYGGRDAFTDDEEEKATYKQALLDAKEKLVVPLPRRYGFASLR
ncbi:hypothetical protein COV04_01690 [Candidatus Uhrbacteria bacterium CG10_big_fil_rev_8_21_14_0_10_48_11]|uniref:Carbonic anhydrase n=1 Tax=Candidatus Uhrbacteria bacterium CG10_big_fil_rev_8_21_14_0_10_48_11 TaxID=1975037 RepID=A0A2M8LF08_9BACT|nr:MAG: hypothetical protein COV04_01690 [Candidatus Uhrbacteria bacterium CG10_big_fil_rev_8_21_14_0_10_48_11]